MTRSGVILAAGDGARLGGFIRRLRGDALPKQFVPFWGDASDASMFERTVSRAETLIPSDRLLTVVGRHHLAFPEAARQVASRPPGTVIAQPQNRETGPGLLLPLVHLAARDPDGVVVIFPSDHFIAEEGLFMSYVEQACRAVERNPSRLILVGAEPYAPEPAYGYILPGQHPDDAADGVRPLAGFVEKPQAVDAARLVRGGALWNTLVMVVRINTLWALVRWCSPGLYHHFVKVQRAIGTRREQAVTEEVYQAISPVNFSRSVLEVVARDDPRRVAVVPARGVYWSDWGSEQRVLATCSGAAASGSGGNRPLRPSSATESLGRFATRGRKPLEAYAFARNTSAWMDDSAPGRGPATDLSALI